MTQKDEALAALESSLAAHQAEKSELIANTQSENSELMAEISQLREAAAARRSDGANVSKRARSCH